MNRSAGAPGSVKALPCLRRPPAPVSPFWAACPKRSSQPRSAALRSASSAFLAVAGSAIAGRPMLIPTLLMQAIFVLIGTSLGAVVTPETLHGMATYPLSIAVLILAMAVISVGGAGYLRLVHRWGTIDSYLAAAPGGMSQVLALGAELGGDLRAIAIVQSIRVVVIAVGLPAGLSVLGLVGHAPPRPTIALSIA